VLWLGHSQGRCSALLLLLLQLLQAPGARPWHGSCCTCHHQLLLLLPLLPRRHWAAWQLHGLARKLQRLLQPLLLCGLLWQRQHLLLLGVSPARLLLLLPLLLAVLRECSRRRH
jgi:hypothetical protein